MQRLKEALIELCVLYAKDETERADLQATGILKKQFGADAAALFYLDDALGFRYCLAGSDFPISLSETRWHDSVEAANRGTGTIEKFGPWSVPGFESELSHWMSARLYAAGDALGYLLLGRNRADWTAEEAEALSTIVQTINPIVEVRMERNRAEAERVRAQKKLDEKARRLRAFFEGSPDMIYTADAEDRLSSINYAGVRLLGYQNAAELVGRPMQELAMNPDDRLILINRVAKDGYSADYEIIMGKKDGTPIFCMESTTAIKNADGRIIEIQGIVKDISDRIMNERELWKTNLELVDLTMKLQKTQALMVQHEKLASIGQLAAGVAHEINNPLGYIKSNHSMAGKYLNKLKAAVGDAAAPVADSLAGLDQVLKESEEGLGRIIRIVSDLKSFSRVDQGDAWEYYDLNAGIESTLVVAWNEIKYVADVVKDFGELPKIRAKGGEINQVILNILVNAAQAIRSQHREGKGRIEISTRHIGNRIHLEIEDDGPGIPEKVRSRIFDPFFTTKAPGEGTGLGLSISYNIIVNTHGGKISADSQEGKGTAFIIELPAESPAV